MPASALRSGQTGGVVAAGSTQHAHGGDLRLPTPKDLLLPSFFCASSLQTLLELVVPSPLVSPSPSALLGGDEALSQRLGLGALPSSPEAHAAHWQRLSLVVRLAALACASLWTTGDVTGQLGVAASKGATDSTTWRWGDASTSGWLGVGPAALPPIAGPRRGWLQHVSAAIVARWDRAVRRLDSRPAMQFQSLTSLLDHALRRGAMVAGPRGRNGIGRVSSYDSDDSEEG